MKLKLLNGSTEMINEIEKIWQKAVSRAQVTQELLWKKGKMSEHTTPFECN